MNRTFKRAALVALLIAGTASWAGAQTYQDRNQSDSQKQQDQKTRQQQERYQSTSTSIQQGKPEDVNKASTLIGMDVKNPSGEKLGTIKDIVFDLDSSRVAYCVLASDPGVLQGEKLHAVPLNAFQRSAEGDSLTLNASKDKLAKAQGFDKNNWPNVNNPTWGAEPFWEKTDSMHNYQNQQRDINRSQRNSQNQNEYNPNSQKENETTQPR